MSVRYVVVVAKDKVDGFLKGFLHQYKISLEVVGLTYVSAYPDCIEIQVLGEQLTVTGRREDMSGHLQGLVRRIRAITSVPIVLGVGISTPEQAGIAAGLADGVIVGSALVAEVLESGQPTSAAAFADAVHGAGR